MTEEQFAALMLLLDARISYRAYKSDLQDALRNHDAEQEARIAFGLPKYATLSDEE